LIIQFDFIIYRKITAMKAFGIFLLIIGILLGMYALQMDTSVAVDYDGGNSYGFPDRVVNLSLMQQRQNYLIAAGVISLIGVILIAAAKPAAKPEAYKYTLHMELAEKAEFKEKYVEALDEYQNTLFHFQKEYVPRNKRDKKIMEDYITKLKLKIGELKRKNSSLV
jgi:hypothetical protein